MSIPRPGHDYCPSCHENDPALCHCRMYCSECGGCTNHTTAQHEQAARVMCQGCGVILVQDEDRKCPECVQEEWEAREDDWYDGLAKDQMYIDLIPDEGGSN